MPSDEKLPKPKFPLPWPRPTLDAGVLAARDPDLPLARHPEGDPHRPVASSDGSQPSDGDDPAAEEYDLQRPRRKVTGRFPRPGPRHGDQNMSHQEQLDDTMPGVQRKPSWR